MAVRSSFFSALKKNQKIMQTAPIALFVYNRPEHTRRVIEALLGNSLVSQSDLYIFSDGPRRDADRRKVAEVRDILASVSGFRSVLIREARENRGLAVSIIDGVSSVLQEHGRVIVLEDDLVTSPVFLDFMNEALNLYAEDEEVMHVSGYWFPLELKNLPETFFLRMPFSWGWATWARAWASFEKNPAGLVQQFSPENIRQFNLDGSYDVWEQVLHNLQGKANTWAVFWYASIFRRGGLCLYPSQSLVFNLGNDGTGVHCLKTSHYDVALRETPVTEFSREFKENTLALSRLQDFHQRHRISRLRRFVIIFWMRLMRRLSGVAVL